MTFEFKIEEKKDHAVIYFKGNLLQENQTLDFMDEFNSIIAQNYSVFHVYLNNLSSNQNGIFLLVKILTKARIAGGEVNFYNPTKELMDLIAILNLNLIIKPITEVAA